MDISLLDITEACRTIGITTLYGAECVGSSVKQKRYNTELQQNNYIFTVNYGMVFKHSRDITILSGLVLRTTPVCFSTFYRSTIVPTLVVNLLIFYY